jgi:ribonuclease R
MAAERSATDRYIAAFLADRVGAEFEGRITGVTKFGLFIRLDETGADGLAPVSTLGGEYYVHDERSHALVGERTGRRWPLGLAVTVRLAEATPVTGGLLFHMISEPEPALEGAERGGANTYLRRPGGRPGFSPGFRRPPKDKGARGKNTPKKKKGARRR